ncbi:MAG: amylo-alpha-1,6-glucosidase [Bacillota bacterium]|nr:amylo-alpha-1,6-glucosidase [Bacillota bacterium]
MDFSRTNWRTFERGIEKEWLITNGIGGFASSTVIGANTRRYHGLLVASLNPPVARHLIVSKLDETIEADNMTYNLSSFRTPDFTMNGYQYLDHFSRNPLPCYYFRCDDIFIEKKICMVHGKNTIIVLYHIINGNSSIKLRLTPLLNFRDYHFNSKREYMNFKYQENGKRIIVTPYELETKIALSCSEGSFVGLNDCFFYNMDYAIERERGLDSTEDHFIPGYFEAGIMPGEEKYITFAATIEKGEEVFDGCKLIREEEERLLNLTDSSDEFVCELTRAADDFIVYRKSTDAKTILAGYPWFTDWGRDTMIAFPGLTLVTGRFKDAKEILDTFKRYISNGLVPNVFPDEGQQPAYNSVDAALWYFQAVKSYLDYTDDKDYLTGSLLDVLTDIVNHFINGTLYNIKMDTDGLITAGNEQTQLTWMDAKVGDWVITPRQGKAVEVNALWYNALRILGYLYEVKGGGGRKYEELAELTGKSFTAEFWNEDYKCLYDVINGEYKDTAVRPNQILSVSLAYPAITGEKAKAVVDMVWKKLLTPYGLRTLAADSKEYRGQYIGNQYNRDSSYHQGTVWPWLMGPFITAYLRTWGYNKRTRQTALKLLGPLKEHIYDACLGNISEIFDGNQPFYPRGCFAQAWSVGEILRVYSDLIK